MGNSLHKFQDLGYAIKLLKENIGRTYYQQTWQFWIAKLFKLIEKAGITIQNIKKLASS